jgi:hypothetical protein
MYCAYLAAVLEEDAERREDDGEDEVDEGRRVVPVRHYQCSVRSQPE